MHANLSYHPVGKLIVCTCDSCAGCVWRPRFQDHAREEHDYVRGKGVGADRGNFRQVGCHLYIPIDCGREWRLRREDSGGQREYGKRHERRKAEEKIQAASVNTGSGMKDGKLKSKDFFDAEQDPYITFHSTKIVQTGPTTFDIPGTFTIRGVSRTKR